jgi:hypothetical protein
MVPAIVEKAVGGLAAEPTGSAVKNEQPKEHQLHEEAKHQSTGGSQHQM